MRAWECVLSDRFLLSPVILNFCWKKKLGQGNKMIAVMPSISKSSFIRMFSVRMKMQSPPVFKFLRFEVHPLFSHGARHMADPVTV